MIFAYNGSKLEAEKTKKKATAENVVALVFIID